MSLKPPHPLRRSTDQIEVSIGGWMRGNPIIALYVITAVLFLVPLVMISVQYGKVSETQEQIKKNAQELSSQNRRLEQIARENRKLIRESADSRVKTVDTICQSVNISFKKQAGSQVLDCKELVANAKTIENSP